MIKRSLLLLAWLSTICWLGAQITVNGHVTISNSLQAVPGHQVDLITELGFIISTETNDDGSFTFELDQTVLPPDAVWFVQTIDICTGDVLSESFTTNPNQQTYSVELTICGDVFPPPPPEGCEAFFHWEQAIGTATNPFAVAFFDLSFSNEPIVSWNWSFGDGTSSSEQNPTHQYNGPGEYEVTLTISSEDCTNTITQVVTVWTENNCDCPLDVYDPVCVATPSGQILEFSQPCLAECAGFGPDIYYPCMEGCGCPEYWDPVCVTTPDGNVLTFSNFCFAECEGYTADQYYSCNGCDCPLIYDPVCVVDPNGDLLTFSNACMAECEGYGADQFVPCDGCNCPDVWDPVCVFTTGGVLSFPTPCDAECAGYGPNQYTSCDGCPCPEIADPVCVVGPDGTLIQFDNPCFAGCEGYGPDQFVPCDGCVCPDVWDPVCVFTAAGSITFGNACLAECAGYGPDQYGSCNECPCPEIYDPVCVVGPNGDIIEFDNACFAGCEGYGADSFVDCTPNCDCPQDVYDPVCIIVPDCGILDFINPCEAECAGYTADQWTQCPIDCLCPDVWDPVCVMTPFGRYTFGNACEAECYGYSEADFIPCIDDCICPLIYDPVCVIDPAGNLLTFDNACFAQCEGYGEDQFVNCTNNCPCPAIYDPVCVVGPNGDVITFNNLCEAECEGYGPDQIVPCNGICDCPDVYYPVCVTDPTTGEQLQFPNPCLAICEGYGDQTLMDCDDCHCINPVWDPVCVEAGGGIITYMNSCEATCAGFTQDQWMECGDCVCPQVYDPVCVYTPSGGVLTFNNACEAECAGYGPEVYTECDGGCNCPDVWDPVCVATGGAILQFGNACEAECAGYTDYFSCDTDPCSVMIHYDQIDELTFVFAAVSPSPIGGFVWDFGDGTSSEEPNPTHTYPDDFVGTFTVTVTFTGTQGCVATASVMITIGDDCICPDVWDPVCVFDPNGNVLTFGNACEAECAGYTDYFECDNNNCPVAIDFEPIDQFTYIFNAITTSTAGQVVWDFGDGEFSDEPSATHTFPEGPGTYQVTVTFTSADGCTSTASVAIIIGDECNCDDVWDPVCVAGFAGLITFPNACEAICAGFSPDVFVPCDECPCPAIYDPVCVLGPNGNIITFGNACEAECAGYGPDTFVDCNGCECGDVYEPVCVQTPIGIITYNNSCEASCAGYCFEDFVSCDDDCICPDIYAPVCVINWTTGEIIEFVNSCYAQCAGYGPDQQFPCDGPECYAAFDFTFSSSNDLLVQFHDQSFAGGGITSWWWDFGDGSGSDEQNPQHTYPAPGIYDVTLTVSGPDCSATIIQHICVDEGGGVGGPDCQAMFFFEQPDASNLLIFSFADISFGGADSWLWDFGDGSGSTEQNPTHTYASPGLYDVTLTITNGDCSSSITMTVFTGINVWYGNDECRAWFLPIIDPSTNSVYFVNLSSADAIEFVWDFGDGTTSTNPLAFHAYEAGGEYTVSLTITTESGCVNTFSATFTLGVEGDDGFTGNPIFSLVNSVDEAPVEELAVALAPNPTRAESIVSWQGTTAGTYSWNLYDLNGRLLAQGSGHSRGQLEQFELDLTRFSSGIYLLRLQTPDGTRALKVTKM